YTARIIQVEMFLNSLRGQIDQALNDINALYDRINRLQRDKCKDNSDLIAQLKRQIESKKGFIQAAQDEVDNTVDNFVSDLVHDLVLRAATRGSRRFRGAGRLIRQIERIFQ
ncbi:MAG: hypothetical protein NXH75_17390, partial [Halobacteriovoraceae bacterium]|nr:hypothetical protein [Halobacteriovoraceae bacterium]